MIDPTTVPDALPVTGIPWLDATAKILGFLFALLVLLANTLPKLSPVTQAIAKIPDFRNVVGKAAAKAEAVAQAVGKTTVAPDEQFPAPVVAPAAMFPKSSPPPAPTPPPKP